MTEQEFNKILEERLGFIEATLAKKAEEYAIGDRLYNFKRAAEFERETPQKALLGMWAKHIVSVLDLLEGKLTPTEYLINEKFGDAINYLILGEAILKEQLAEQLKQSEQSQNFVEIKISKKYVMCINSLFNVQNVQIFTKGSIYTYFPDSFTYEVIDNFGYKRHYKQQYFDENFITISCVDLDCLKEELNENKNS